MIIERCQPFDARHSVTATITVRARAAGTPAAYAALRYVAEDALCRPAAVARHAARRPSLEIREQMMSMRHAQRHARRSIPRVLYADRPPLATIRHASFPTLLLLFAEIPPRNRLPRVRIGDDCDTSLEAGQALSGRRRPAATRRLYARDAAMLRQPERRRQSPPAEAIEAECSSVEVIRLRRPTQSPSHHGVSGHRDTTGKKWCPPRLACRVGLYSRSLSCRRHMPSRPPCHAHAVSRD